MKTDFQKALDACLEYRAEIDRLKIENLELKNAIAIGEMNCDAEYERLREERDESIKDKIALFCRIQELEIENNAMRSTSRGKERLRADKLERENVRLKDALKTGEMPDPVWSKDDLCFMYRKALEERDEADKENAALKVDKGLLDSNTICLTVDGQPVWFDGCDLRKAIQMAMKYKNPQSKS